jgi:hypothetical protein
MESLDSFGPTSYKDANRDREGNDAQHATRLKSGKSGTMTGKHSAEEPASRTASVQDT